MKPSHPTIMHLRDVRRRKQITQEDLARRVGCHRSLIGRWERTGNPNLLNFLDWAEALGLEVVLVKKGE